MRLAERMERIAKASDSVKMFVTELAVLFDQVREESRFSGGFRIDSFNPLVIDWWVNLPEEEEEEK